MCDQNRSCDCDKECCQDVYHWCKKTEPHKFIHPDIEALKKKAAEMEYLWDAISRLELRVKFLEEKGKD